MWAEKDKKFLQNPQANVFVNNIDQDLDTKILYDTCTILGDVLSCKISRDDEGNSLGYGFVQFSNEEEAKQAVDKLNGLELSKKPLYACIMGQTNDPSNWTNCFFQNIPNTWTEVELAEFLKEVAEPSGIRLLRNKDGTNVGKGCVNFATHDEAVKAVEILNNKEIKGLKDKFVITRYVSKEERRNISKDCDLYVKNIPLTMTDEEFKSIFEPYGEITSIKIERDSSNDKINRGFGYVCYKHKEDAAVAIKEKDSCIINGKRLYVAVKQSQNERRMNRNKPNNNNNNNSNMYPGYYPGVGAPPGGTMNNNARIMMMMNPMMSRYAYNNNPSRPIYPNTTGSTNGSVTPPPPHMMMYPMMRSMYPMPIPQPQPQSSSTGTVAKPITTTTNTTQKSTNLPIPVENETAKKDAFLTHIYNTVAKKHPDLAQRITGMFTDMSANDLSLIINTPGALDSKITEALNILNNIKS